MRNITLIGRIQIIVILIFFVMKKFVRPFVIERDSPTFMDIIVYSFPNLCEGIIGTLTASVVLLYINKQTFQWKETSVYLIATFLAAVYVISQEFKLHNIGGNNIYDPYDVVFSIVGLGIGLSIVWKLKPSLS